MAQEVALGTAGSGKVRSFGVGFGLTVITLGIYYWFWYFYVNDELRDIGISRNDPTLANSRPARSVTAVILGGFLIVPPFLSVYNYGRRIERAERSWGSLPRSGSIQRSRFCCCSWVASSSSRRSLTTGT